MNVTLEAIKFNHIANSATCDGFSIRRNETRRVPSPEWQRGVTHNSEDSPAAYALWQTKNQPVTVQARFTCTNPQVKSIWIRAVDGNLYLGKLGLRDPFRFAIALLRPFLSRVVETNVLGAVRPKQISPSTGPEDFQTFELEDVRLEEAGIGVNDIVWRWQFSHDGTDWSDMATTRHRIYTVLSLPKGPWQPNSKDASDTQLPWTDVLEYACRWAAGALSYPEIAARITNAVYALGTAFMQYDSDTAGSPHYTPDDPPRFDCQRFVDLLKGQSQNTLDPNVDCDDCATIVSSLACILGYPLKISSMKSVAAAEIPLRRHQKIGRVWEGYGEFLHHTVAWNGDFEGEVSDACLMLDEEWGSGAPIPVMSTNLQFASNYRHRLVVKGAAEFCRWKPDSTFFRRIGLSTDGDEPEPVAPDLEWIKRYYNYDKWPKALSSRELSDLSALFSENAKFNGWQVKRARLIPIDSYEFFISRQQKGRETVLRLDAWTVRNEKEIDTSLLLTLGRFELPGVKLLENAGFGERAFANASEHVAVFSRSRLIVMIRNVAGSPIALSRFATFIDLLLLGQTSIALENLRASD